MNIRIDLAEHTVPILIGCILAVAFAVEVGHWLERWKAASSAEDEEEDEEEEPSSHPYRDPAEGPVKAPRSQYMCVGYVDDTVNEMRADCDALRLDGCNDGRCRYHCRSMCECEDA